MLPSFFLLAQRFQLLLFLFLPAQGFLPLPLLLLLAQFLLPLTFLFLSEQGFLLLPILLLATQRFLLLAVFFLLASCLLLLPFLLLLAQGLLPLTFFFLLTCRFLLLAFFFLAAFSCQPLLFPACSLLLFPLPACRLQTFHFLATEFVNLELKMRQQAGLNLSRQTLIGFKQSLEKFSLARLLLWQRQEIPQYANLSAC